MNDGETPPGQNQPAGHGPGSASRAQALEPEPAPSHVLIVDDDERLRDLLKRFLSRNGYLVTTSRDAAHATRLLVNLAFDLLVVDVMMPGEDGLAFTRRIREEIDTPILLLTARGDADDRIEGLEAGADDYLAKPFEPRELLLRCAAILRRSLPKEEPEAPLKTLILGSNQYDIQRGELVCEGQPVRLTSTEQALMRVFANQPNQPITREKLAEQLGGTGGEVQERAVDVQITRLRRKLEIDPKAPRYLQTVRGAGYMLTPD